MIFIWQKRALGSHENFKIVSLSTMSFPSLSWILIVSFRYRPEIEELHTCNVWSGLHCNENPKLWFLSYHFEMFVWFWRNFINNAPIHMSLFGYWPVKVTRTQRNCDTISISLLSYVHFSNRESLPSFHENKYFSFIIHIVLTYKPVSLLFFQLI